MGRIESPVEPGPGRGDPPSELGAARARRAMRNALAAPLGEQREPWLADLETWPEVFRAAVRERAARVLWQATLDLEWQSNLGTAAIWERCRRDPGQREPGHPAFLERVRQDLRMLGSRHGPGDRRYARRDLLWTLWLYGRRRIQRGELPLSARVSPLRVPAGPRPVLGLERRGRPSLCE